MYDVCWLRSWGLTIKGPIVDTMIAASLVTKTDELSVKLHWQILAGEGR